MHIFRYEISDIVSKLPDINYFSWDQNTEILLATLGFEPRSPNIALLANNCPEFKLKKLLLIEYPTNKEDNAGNLAEFNKAATRIGGPEFIKYDKNKYSDSLRAKLDALGVTEGTRVCFDISTCSSYLFYPTMAELFRRSVNLKIAYTEALTYFPTKEEWEEVSSKAEREQTLFKQSFENAAFLSSGLDEIYPYSMFGEINSGNISNILVTVPNFSALRMAAIIQKDKEVNKTLQDNIIWVIGNPPADENRWRANAVEKTNIRASVGSDKKCLVSTLNYKDMVFALENIWEKNKYDKYMTIGSLGSKNQHLGCFIFLYLHRDIGIWLAEPKRFRSDRFSLGVGNTWEIDFGDVNISKAIMSKYMQYECAFDNH